jgi:hypothetical protein
MRVLFASLLAVSALGLVACSGGTEGSSLQRQRATGDDGTPTASGGTKTSGSKTAPAPTAPESAPAPEPAPAMADAGAPPPPAPAPATPSSCGAPTCFGLGGFGGCKATDSAGALVTMACQDGLCGCFAGGQTTATFDGDVNSSDQAAQLFVANCTCN